MSWRPPIRSSRVPAASQTYSLAAEAPAGWKVAFKPSGQSMEVSSIGVSGHGTQGMTITVTPPEAVEAGTYVIPVTAVSSAQDLASELKVTITGTYDLDVLTADGRLSFDASVLMAGGREERSFELCMDLLFNSWCPLVDAAIRHRKGGAPKGNQNAKGNKGGPGRPKKTQPKTQPFNENDNSNVNENENKRDGLTPPLSEGEGEATALPGAVGEEEEEWKWGDPLEQLEEWKREHEQSV